MTLKRAKAMRRAMTKPEVLLWTRLRKGEADFPRFRRQQPFGPYILDFFCSAARLAIEVDGAQHAEDARIGHDERRDRWLAAQGVKVYRVPASSVLKSPQDVADGIRLIVIERLRGEV